MAAAQFAGMVHSSCPGPTIRSFRASRAGLRRAAWFGASFASSNTYPSFLAVQEQSIQKKRIPGRLRIEVETMVPHFWQVSDAIISLEVVYTGIISGRDPGCENN